MRHRSTLKAESCITHHASLFTSLRWKSQDDGLERLDIQPQHATRVGEHFPLLSSPLQEDCGAEYRAAYDHGNQDQAKQTKGRQQHFSCLLCAERVVDRP